MLCYVCVGLNPQTTTTLFPTFHFYPPLILHLADTKAKSTIQRRLLVLAVVGAAEEAAVVV